MTTLIQAVTTFLQVDRRYHTNRQYRFILLPAVHYLGAERELHRIRYEDLLDYQTKLRDRLKPATVRNYTQVLKSFFTWCVDRQYIAASPAADIVIPRARRDPRIRAIPADELGRMVEYARVTSPRDYAILLFLADTACRVGGIVTLTIPNLDIPNRTGLIQEKGGVWHRVWFGDETAAALDRWLSKRPRVRHDHVFTASGRWRHRPLNRQGIAGILLRICQATSASRNWTPHSIRHAVGHAYAQAGVPVTVTQMKLGHSDPSITLHHYYPDDAELVRQVSHANPLIALRQPAAIGIEQPRVIPFAARKAGR